MNICASYQVQFWQTVFCSEIANFLTRKPLFANLKDEQYAL